MDKLFKGVITNLITPFDDGGSVDIRSLRKVIRYQLENQIDGIMLFGYIGEGYTMSDNEKYNVLEATLEEVDEKIPVYVAFGEVNTGRIIAKAKEFETYHVDGFIIAPPNVSKSVQSGVARHIQEISENVSTPILFKVIPYGYNHIEENIDVDTMLQIMDLPNIKGIVLSKTYSVIKIASEKKKESLLLTGNDFKLPAYIPFLIDGILSTSSNVLPSDIKRFFKYITEFSKTTHNVSLTEARESLRVVQHLIEKLSYDTNPLLIKYALSKLKYCEEICRLPFTDLDKKEMDIMDELLIKKFNLSDEQEEEDYKSL